MKTSIKKVGSSQVVLIPQPVLDRTGLEVGEVELAVDGDTIIIRKPGHPPRAGWAEAAKRIAAAKDDGLVWPEFPNEGDGDVTW